MTTRPRLHRPRSVYIECLENRIAPATFVVTSLDDSGAGSLRDAIAKANALEGADTIIFKGAATSGEITLSSGEIAITDSVNIKGPGAGNLIIDAQNLSRIFNITDSSATVKKVTISGLGMVDGNSGGGNSGGAILSFESLTLTNSVISGCVAPGDGGAISITTSGKLIIRDSKLTGNSATILGGGAVSASAAGGVQILSTLIAHNSTEGGGGGVILFSAPNARGDMVIDSSTISHNSASEGGGIWANNDRQVGGRIVGKITVRDSVVADNSASTSGGGVYLSDGNAIIDRSLIVNNTAGRVGGGLSSNTIESLTIRSSEFLNNDITTTNPVNSGGGAIYINGDKQAVIQRTLISDNTSTVGGGIRAIQTRLTLQASTITGNTASSDGGGIYARGGSINVLNSTAQDNQASDFGGGLATSRVFGSSTDLRVAGSLFSGNRAGYSGGGVSASGDGRVEILNSRFLGNAAAIGGGGLYLVSNLSPISIANSEISQNTSGESGGGLAVLAGADGVAVTITRTLVADNITSGDGGGIHVAGVFGTFTFAKSVIRDNVAKETGGGIWTSPTVTLKGSTVTGNIAPDGPQIFGPFTP